MTNYLNNEKFEETVAAYVSSNIIPNPYADELVDYFILLTSNIITSFKFSLDHEDASQDCILLLLKVVPNWTPEKGKAFNYFTTIIVNQLKQIYSRRKKYYEKIMTYQSLKDQSDI